jgi:hypothetical protein
MLAKANYMIKKREKKIGTLFFWKTGKKQCNCDLLLLFNWNYNIIIEHL